jgi:rhamnogalacturonyl hydrolase YesR
MKYLFIVISFLGFLASCKLVKKEAYFGSTKHEVLEIIKKVNTHWQNQHPKQTNSFWHTATYQTGNIEAYKVTQVEDYKTYAEAWAQHNQWKGAKSNIKSEWKYSYGEKDNYVLFGDWQICFQVYIDLYHFDENKDSNKIARAIEVMEYQMQTPHKDYWWWADGLYMVMPVMTKLYQLTGKEIYLDKLYEYYVFADSLMQDKDTHLFFRDAKYVYPKHKSINGKKDFWARGNGWVLAGLAKVLNDLPKKSKHYPYFLSKYKALALAVAEAQQPVGYWTRSMLDTEHAPGPETSGTAFFTYGLLWGINNGVLDKKYYLPVLNKSWKYLTDVALQSDGTIGYVQPIGERAIPGQVVDKNSTANFGVGAFLLAAAEMYRYLD